MFYLDSAATTAIDPEVLDAMIPYLTGWFGNAGSTHEMGRIAKKAIDEARVKVADLINAEPDQIIFTSGGSESNNMIIKTGILKQILEKPAIKFQAISNSEHDSILNALVDLKFLEDKVKRVEIPIHHIDEDDAGSINLSVLKTMISTGEIGFVSAMYINNETGAENPIKEIGELCKNNDILFHTDCVQAASTHKIDVKDFKCDFLSLSSHKIYGPKGVGAAFVKDKRLLSPIISGGASQEFGLRGGTENVAGIVGFGAACDLVKRNLHDIDVQVSVLKQVFYNELKKWDTTGGKIMLNSNIFRHGKILNIRINGIESETLMLMLDAHGVCVSAGSACRSHEQKPSRTLLDMGLTEKEARSSIRISFSKDNTKEEVIGAAHIMIDCIKILEELNN